MDFEKLLKFVVEKGASDLFITAGVPPSVKLNGRLTPVTRSPLSPDQAKDLVYGVMNSEQQRVFNREHECNFAIATRALGRFRVSAFQQRNMVGMVLRRIETNIPTLSDLKLPPILRDLAMTKRGLIIFVGATGTGKSTSLAAMIGHRNMHSKGHIISIEDPIEYIHQHQG
jgi:twitching motility protein PilU